jgi:hypothetical protein
VVWKSNNAKAEQKDQFRMCLQKFVRFRKGKLMDRRLMTIGLVLLFLCFFSTRFSLEGYELEYVLSAGNIFHGKGPALLPGYTGCPGIADTDGDTLVYPRQNLLQSYLSVPFYALGYIFFGEKPAVPNRGNYWELPWGPIVTVSLLNPILAGLIAVLVGLISRDLGILPPGHYVVAILYGITSMNWHYGALGMEVLQTAVLTASVWCAIRYRVTGKNSWFIAVLILLPMLANCKKISFLFVIPVSVYLIWSLWQHKPVFAKKAAVLIVLSAVAGICLMVATVVMRFRSDPNLFPHLLRTYLDSGFKTVDLIFALTISPGQGVLIFNPMLWFAIPAWSAFYRRNSPEALLFLAIAIILCVLVKIIPYVLLDESWGPRYLFTLLPFAYIAGARGLLTKRIGLAKKVFLTVLIISVAIQWLSTMYLGFELYNISIDMGISDHMTAVWTPSLSQIWLAGTCFVSHLYRQNTGVSLVTGYRQFLNYIGRGGGYIDLRQTLDEYDHPSGGWFIVRWVLSERGRHGFTQSLALSLKIVLDALLVAWLGVMAYKSWRLYSV